MTTITYADYKRHIRSLVVEMKGEIELPRYTYHYERPNGYFFRYEREESDDLIRKPEYHMHVILDPPHFPAPLLLLFSLSHLRLPNPSI